MGGLGNQLFQVAAAMSLALDVQDDFGINHEICYTPNQGNVSSKYSSTFFKLIPSISKEQMPTRVYHEPTFRFTPLIKERDQMIFGYFQSEKYFLPYKQRVLDTFTPSQSELGFVSYKLQNRRGGKQLVSVHIRRGDYLKFSHHHYVQSVDYYKAAMAQFPDALFLIISDDLDWAKQNIKGDNVIYSPFENEVNDFYAMVCCDHNIISNSTFSWWAAYLNQHEGRTVIAPKNWYNELAGVDIADLLPADWKVV
jgi:hypothetical protein